jgi:ethylbenzene dioxygenase subunit beta
MAEPGVPFETWFAIQQFLFREARLLDEDRYDDWHALIAEDIHYHMPARRGRYKRERREHAVDTDHFDDDYGSLRLRVERLKRPGVPSMDPPPRTCRIVSNVEVEPAATPGEYRVHSTVQLTRNRLYDEDETLTARRTDTLRSDGNGGFRIARREIATTQNVIRVRNLNCLI